MRRAKLRVRTSRFQLRPPRSSSLCTMHRMHTRPMAVTGVYRLHLRRWRLCAARSVG